MLSTLHYNDIIINRRIHINIIISDTSRLPNCIQYFVIIFMLVKYASRPPIIDIDP